MFQEQVLLNYVFGGQLWSLWVPFIHLVKWKVQLGDTICLPTCVKKPHVQSMEASSSFLLLWITGKAGKLSKDGDY